MHFQGLAKDIVTSNKQLLQTATVYWSRSHEKRRRNANHKCARRVIPGYLCFPRDAKTKARGGPRQVCIKLDRVE